MNFLFTCGGTAGHINPALAVAGILRDRMPDCGILFVGANGKMETDLVPRAGYDIVTIEVTNIHRSLKPSEIAYNFRSLHNARQATKDAQDHRGLSARRRHRHRRLCLLSRAQSGGAARYPHRRA